MLDALLIEFVQPFVKSKSRRKRTLAHYTRKPGVYLIKEEDEIVYIGMSQSCVVEALYRHFYKWNDHRPNGPYTNRVTYVNRLESKTYKVMILPVTKEQAPQLEKGLVYAMRPRDNRDKFEVFFSEIKEVENEPITNVSDDRPF